MSNTLSTDAPVDELRLLTTAQVTELLHVSRPTLRKLGLPVIRLGDGTQNRYRYSDVAALIG